MVTFLIYRLHYFPQRSIKTNFSVYIIARLLSKSSKKIKILTIYFSQSGGYYEFELHKKTVFTEEKIKQFEKDVADGKDVSIEDYLVNEKKNYSNKASQIGYFFSKNIGNYIKKGIEGTFKMINKMVE